MGRRGGFLAAVARGMREAERTARRRQRELHAQLRHEQRIESAAQRYAARRAAEIQREEELRYAELEAEAFSTQIEVLLSVHRDAVAPINWRQVAKSRQPSFEPPDDSDVVAARHALDTYTPGFFAKLFGFHGQRRALESALEEAMADHQQRDEEDQLAHQEEVDEWRDSVALAQAVLADDAEAFDRVISETACLEELEELGCVVRVEFSSPSVANVAVRCAEADIVPTEEKKLTAKGKLSTKKMPAARVTEIYQDFVCGAAIRAAREVMAVLPVSAALVDVWSKVLNQATGHFDDVVVLSVYFPREALGRVNFARADASDFVGTLVHRMSFKRGKGMAPVEPLVLSSLMIAEG